MNLSPQSSQPRGQRTITMACSLLALLLCSSGLTRAADPRQHSYNQPPPDFAILSPGFGSYQTGQVEVELQYITHNEDPKIQLQLNGRTVNHGRLRKSCEGATCTITGKLTVWDGLRVGENQLSATLAGRLYQPTRRNASSATPVLIAHTRFDYFEGLGGGVYNSINYYTPVSLGLTTIPGGGGSAGTPWMQLTSGYPADWNATADAYAFPNLPGPPDPETHEPTTLTKVTIPYPDISLGFTCTGGTFQAYVLGRQNPYLGGPDDQNVETGACFDSISDLQAQFQAKFSRPLGSQDLVIMGTAPGQTVPPGFDASPLGGTNFSQTPVSEYPQAYIMIGVPGAAAGTAYESFGIPTAPNRPSTPYQPSLNGTLMQDQYNNYNFVPSGDTGFQAHSGSHTGSYITVENNTYTPPSSEEGFFWLLVLDQETLTPVNYYAGSPYAFQNCNTTATNQSCGAAYTVDADGGAALANELNSLSNAHDLIFLVAQGCPLTNPNQMQSALADVLHSIGGVPYAVNSMNPQNPAPYPCNYSLVTVNDGNHWHPLNDPVALSSSAFSANGQSGSVQGFLARSQHGLYEVASNAQMIPNSDGSGFASPIDYTFEYVSSSQRQDWPLVDTAFPIEAYADLSYQILAGLGKTGSRLYDVRYFYSDSSFLTNSELGSILQNNLIGTPTQPPAQTFTAQPWDNATPAQFTAARQQIGAELQQILSVYGYLGPAGIEGAMAGANSNIFSEMTGMATAISGDYSGAGNANANARLSKVLNLAGGIVGIGSAIPVVGPIFGVVAGGLRVGSASISMGSTPPSPQAVFDTSLTNLSNDYTTYAGDLATGYEGAMNNILLDSGKLSTISALTLDTNSTWNFPSQLSPNQLEEPLKDAAARALWLDIMPQLYGIRQYFNGPSNNPGNYGVYEVYYQTCYNLYYGADPASYAAYNSIGSNATQYDLYVFAEKPVASTHDEVVTKTLSDLLTTTGTSTIKDIQQNNLNFPPMLLYGYSNMSYSPFQAPNGSPAKEVNYCVTNIQP